LTLALIGAAVLGLTACKTVDGMTAGRVVEMHTNPPYHTYEANNGTNWPDNEVQLSGDWDGVPTKCWVLVTPKFYSHLSIGDYVHTVFNPGIIQGIDGKCATPQDGSS